MATIYTFSSTVSTGLFAFTSEQDGNNLPQNHGPWTLMGGLNSSNAPRHRFPKETIQQRVVEDGYQLWRIRKKPDA